MVQRATDASRAQTKLTPLGLRMKTPLLLTFLLLLRPSQGVVITGACDQDMQCGPGSCCAISVWLHGLRMCTPQGQRGDKCHPFSHKVPFFGKRQHHTCPCSAHLFCSRSLDTSFRCTSHFKNMDFH